MISGVYFYVISWNLIQGESIPVREYTTTSEKIARTKFSKIIPNLSRTKVDLYKMDHGERICLETKEVI